MKKKPKQNTSFVDLYQSIRREWNGINPVTKVREDKRFKKEKHKKRELDKELKGE